MSGSLLLSTPLPSLFLMPEGGAGPEGRLLTEATPQGSTAEATTGEMLWAWAFLVILLVMLLCIVCVCCGIFARLCGIGGWVFGCFTRALESGYRSTCGRCCGQRPKRKAGVKLAPAPPAPRPSVAVVPMGIPVERESRITTDRERAELCAGFACCGLGAWCGFGGRRSKRARSRPRDRGGNDMTCIERVLTLNACCGLCPMCFPPSGTARTRALQVAQPVAQPREKTPAAAVVATPPPKAPAPAAAAPPAKAEEESDEDDDLSSWRGMASAPGGLERSSAQPLLGPRMPLLAF